MKHNLGKLLGIWLFLTVGLLYAKDLSYAFSTDTTNPYVKAPVILTVDLKQTNHNIVLLFDFDLQKSDAYTFQRLDVKEEDAYHDAKVRYIYLIYPLKAGRIPVTFKLTKKVTTDASVAYGFSGDRDNVRDMVTVDSEVSLPPVVLQVKPLPQKVDFVGDFRLTHSFKKHKAKAYEPIPFNIVVKGTGYPPLIKDIIPKTPDLTLFKEKPIVRTVHTAKGSRTSVTYPMALSGKKSFDLPEVTLTAFDPKTEKRYTLTIPAQHFEIEKEDPAALVDKTDTPEPFKNDWGWLTSLLSYLLVFGAGYFTAVTLKWKKRSSAMQSDPLKEKIEMCKSEKELLQVLMAADSKKFVSVIEALENGLYKKGKIHLKTLKAEALERL